MGTRKGRELVLDKRTDEVAGIVISNLGEEFIARKLPKVWDLIWDKGEGQGTGESLLEDSNNSDDQFNRSIFNDNNPNIVRDLSLLSKNSEETSWDEEVWGTNPNNWKTEEKEDDSSDGQELEEEEEEEETETSANLLEAVWSEEEEAGPGSSQEEEKMSDSSGHSSYTREQFRRIREEELEGHPCADCHDSACNKVDETEEEEENVSDSGPVFPSIDNEYWEEEIVRVKQEQEEEEQKVRPQPLPAVQGGDGLVSQTTNTFNCTSNYRTGMSSSHDSGNRVESSRDNDVVKSINSIIDVGDGDKSGVEMNNSVKNSIYKNKGGEGYNHSKIISKGVEDFSHSKISKEFLSYFIMNLRGFSSKKPSFFNIVDSSDADFYLISETHMYFDKCISHSKYNFICKSRKVNSKGGIALGYKKELEPYVVKVAEGEGDNEFILVKVTCYEPNLIIGVFYGNQENTAGEIKINNHLSELFSELDQYSKEGLSIIVGGDFNLHVGDKIPGNDQKTSKGGKMLISLCEEMGLEFANTIGPLPNHTHYDVSSKTSRILDFAITNVRDQHKRCEVDNAKKVTPYRIVSKDGEVTPNFTDHLTVIGEVELQKSKAKKKIKAFRYSRPGGKILYRNALEERDLEALNIIQTVPDVDEMFSKISEIIKEVKTETLGVRTMTHKQRERESMNNLAVRRMKELQETMDELDDQKKKLNEKIFIGRKRFENEGGETLEKIKHYKSGEVLSEPKEIYKSILDYNVEVLEKKSNLSEEEDERRKENEEIADFWESVESAESEEPLLWEEFEEVVKKTMAVNKGCYRDFNWAGPRWKSVMFIMFQRIYMTEEIPAVFKKAALKKLYKKKGDKSNLQNYRFIHLRDWASKILEKLVILKSKKLIEKGTPESQLGGRVKSSTIEHLVMAMTVIRGREAEKKAVVMMFVDVVKCFDKVRLRDTLADAASVGVSGKQLRTVRKLHDSTEISIVGDASDQSATVTNSTGQGTQMAPSFCSLSMARALNKRAEANDYGMHYGEVKIKPCSFIDDTKLMGLSSEEVRKCGVIATESLDCMGLDAHPKKSKQVVVGNAKHGQSLINQLESEPSSIQGFDVDFSQQETYLGFEFCSKGSRESVTQSIERRGRMATAKAAQLVKVLEDDLLQKVGWLASAKELFQSIIISTLCYGSQAYIFMTKTQENRLESLMRENLYRVLGLSKFSSYAAVLFELNLIKIADIIKQLKCSYIMSLIHEKGSGQCLEVLNEEVRLDKVKGLIEEVKMICVEFNMPDITIYNIGKENLKKKIWEVARARLWEVVLKDRRVPYHDDPRKYKKSYWQMSKRKALLVFGYQIGNLDFRNNKRRESVRKFGGVNCLIPHCEGIDEIDHVKSCQGYKTKPGKYAFSGNDEELAEYLDNLDNERFSICREPLLFRNKLGTVPKLKK